MSRSKPFAPSNPMTASASLAPAYHPDVGGPSVRMLRETVESIVIAFVLAFMFRTFEAEAFVIPTGSMAPTLQGRHKDTVCQKCGYSFRVSASDEVDQDGTPKDSSYLVRGGSCPQCRYPMSVNYPENRYDQSYNGDRILVGKFMYDFAEPRRWEVVVFKFPFDAKVNYIKRLVGLPGETVRIFHGDIFVRAAGEQEFRIQRKPPDKLRAMMQVVYDNDYIVDELTAKGWPLRWQPSAGDAAWKSDDGGRAYSAQAATGEPAWLVYQHYPPSELDWRELEKGPLPKDRRVAPQLIADLYAYNTQMLQDNRRRPPPVPNWVGDLAVECQLDVASPSGTVHFDLVKSGRHFRCQLDVATGQMRLAIDGVDGFAPTAQTDVRGPGRYHLAFANADDQLVLWVGKTHWYSSDIDWTSVTFDGPTTYDSEALDIDRPRSTPDDPGDLAPVGIGWENGEVKLSHIRVLRDVYYIADNRNTSPISEYRSVIEGREIHGAPLDLSPLAWTEFLSQPKRWRSDEESSPFDARQLVEFELEKDQFFMLGDNSPASADSRAWQEGHFVDRKLLVGKALYIYWPHAWPTGLSIRKYWPAAAELDIPFYPQFSRMKLIR